jgi:uncharacterized phage-associated protein
MLIDHHREKLINAIIYFITNTKYCGKLKLFKLLYFLDFEHFAQTGRSITGLDYYAWKKGPCPSELYDEFDEPKDDMTNAFDFEKIEVNKPLPMLKLSPKRAFDPSHFTKREINILKKLAEEFHDTNSEDIIEKTHLESQPWHRIFEEEGKRFKMIPYEYVVSSDNADLLDKAEESEKFWDAFK